MCDLLDSVPTCLEFRLPKKEADFYIARHLACFVVQCRSTMVFNHVLGWKIFSLKATLGHFCDAFRVIKRFILRSMLRL